MRDRDWLLGDAGRPALRGAGVLGPAWAPPGPGPGPRPGDCLERWSAAAADPGGFCSWSLRARWRAEGKRKEEAKERRDIFRIAWAPSLSILHPQSWMRLRRPWLRWVS